MVGVLKFFDSSCWQRSAPFPSEVTCREILRETKFGWVGFCIISFSFPVHYPCVHSSVGAVLWAAVGAGGIGVSALRAGPGAASPS